MKVARIFVLLAVITAVAFLLVSCGAKREVSKTETRSDSVLVKVETRVEWRHDTIVETIRESEVSELVPKDSASTLEDEYSVSYAGIVDGLLYHSLTTKGRELSHTVMTPTYYRDSVRVEVQRVEVSNDVFIEKELSYWQKFCLVTYPWLLILLFILALVFFFMYSTRNK